MDHNSPIVSCKEEIIKFFKSRPELSHVNIKKAYINVKKDLPLTKPLITVSKGKMITEDISYQNFLNERYDENEKVIIDTKGKILKIFYDFHIWNSTSPKLGGEKEIERIIERIKSIVEFESDVLEDITFLNFEEKSGGEDPDENDLFHSRCTLEIKILWKKEFKFDVIEELIPNGILKEE